MPYFFNEFFQPCLSVIDCFSLYFMSACSHKAPEKKAVFLLFRPSDFSATSQFSQLWSCRHQLVTLILTKCSSPFSAFPFWLIFRVFVFLGLLMLLMSMVP
ncbi:hypothetical protein E2542_SST01646 [Spatholobus suberectus]|nr:hypothetical protein E2542_SST01646 [Spatholobus suberectus]